METKKKGICLIRVAKNISYVLIPIILATLILSVVSILYVNDTEMIVESSKNASGLSDYYQSKLFIEDYWDSMMDRIYRVKNLEDGLQDLMKSIKEKKTEYSEEGIESLRLNQRMNFNYYSKEYKIDVGGKVIPAYYEYDSRNFIYVIIDHKNGVVYGNIEYDFYHPTTESLKEEVLSNKYHWIYENGKVQTSIDYLNDNHLKQVSSYDKYLQSGDYTVYTAVRNDLPYFDNYLSDYILFSVVKHQYHNAIYNIPLAIILLIVMTGVILIGIGKTKKEEGIHLTWFDKLLVEVAVTIVSLIALCICGIAFSIGVNITAIVSIISIMIGLMTLYIACILLLETIVKRLKTHTFLKTTFLYWCYQKMQLISSHMSLSLRVGGCFAGFAIGNWIIFSISNDEPFLAFVLLLALYAFCFISILKRTVWHEKIHGAIREIYKGNSNVRLHEEEYKGELKEVAVQINDIAGGLSNAIEEKMKSERLKTELITNVSHDIKTPLTSIINYVDLLKKEDITTEKAAEYLAILDNKSQRLKKLTEDLVEASKASSGNLKLNMEKLEVNELIKQVSAEFEDKFKAHELEEIVTFTKEPVYIKADSRYMYRVLENMYSNVSKYAMENTRVYTDIIEHGNNVIVQMKNISRQKLNITADELMQRFVRGDTSRNTEGSGLGLSIANSLTELQDGQFHIYLDGDLFKITIGFKKMN